MRVLVLLHIYYEEQIDYYLDKLRNIAGCEWDLTVTGNSLGKYIYMKVKRCIQPFLEWLCSIDYRGDAHEKFLTVLGFRFKLQSQAD